MIDKKLKNQREIEKWEREAVRPRSNIYPYYLIFIISLIYMVDEVASQIGMLMKTEIANDLFARFGDSSLGALEILGAIGMPFQILGLMYRPLADKFGRKLFLAINTLGMSSALFMIYISDSVWLYFIGACLVQFFIPHDMHVVYIMETTDPRHRAKIYSTIKFVATMGIMLIPLLRSLLMENASQWRRVYLIPALIGLTVGFIALFCAKETDAFIDSRIKYLRMTDEEREAEKASAKASEGGVFAALKFAMSRKQLRWLYITAALANIGFIGTINYQVIMSYGFAEGMFGSFTEQIMNTVSLGPVTEALFIYPVGCALSQLIMGYISDSKGRKSAAILVAANSLISFLVFFFGARLGASPYLVGLFCGSFIGSYYSLNDVIIMMVGESSPTNLRSSTMSAQFIVTALGAVVSFAVGLPTLAIFGNTAMGVLSFCLLVPGFAAALFTLWRFTSDTKGMDLETVTGFEWD